MKIYTPTLFVLLLIVSAAFGQGPEAAKSAGPGAPNTSIIPAAPGITANSTGLELARAALAAHGGDKFKNLKSMVLIGSVNVYPPNSAQSVPGKFVMVSVGDMVWIDIDELGMP